MISPLPSTIACRWLPALIACFGMLAEVRGDQAPPFPTDPNSWINSGPLSVSGLKGKGIVLYFFEEDCPKCRAKWPELIEASKKMEGQPVVFIAVNSGNPRAAIQGYVNQVKVPWPVLVDTSRDFEKACGLFQPVSLQNIYQVRYIKPDGEILPGLSDDIEETAEKAAEGAAWKVDPDSVPIPASLKPVWLSVEIGNYKGIGATLKKSASSSKSDVKEAATKLMEVVQKEIDELMAQVKEAHEGSNNYRAFELLTELTEHFNGFELPKESVTLKKELSKDSKVKAGQTAAKSLELARKQLASGNPGLAEKAKKTLEKIVTDFPDTNLSLQAKGLLDE
jgi:thiol-disulfide isomerase/thioredoxin